MNSARIAGLAQNTHSQELFNEYTERKQDHRARADGLAEYRLAWSEEEKKKKRRKNIVGASKSNQFPCSRGRTRARNEAAQKTNDARLRR